MTGIAEFVLITAVAALVAAATSLILNAYDRRAERRRQLLHRKLR